MRFELSHDFDIPLDALELAVISPELPERLARNLARTIEKVETRSYGIDDGRLARVLAFQADLPLPAFARGAVTKDMLAWEERVAYDLRAHRSTWVIEPRVRPEWKRYFRAEGVYTLERIDEARTRRVVQGEVELDVKLVRQVAERLIVAEVRKMFEAEATTLKELATLT